jgi:hypothetical protein
MPNIITAGNSTNGGTAITTDTSGTLNIVTGSGSGTTAVTVDGSQNLAFNSGYGSVATAYGCRAWVNFNGTGTVAIRASRNVTSITDNGVGAYTVNFTTAMPDANYSATISSALTSNYPILGTGTPATSAFSIAIANQTASAQTAADSSSVFAVIFR